MTMAEQLETDVWKEIRVVLKAGLIAGTIPEEPKEMRPKEVYQKFVGATIDYRDKKHKKSLLVCFDLSVQSKGMVILKMRMTLVNQFCGSSQQQSNF
jgi:hypothetical protein